MTRFFYDFEFYEDGALVRPISIGVVSSAGERYYRVYADWLYELGTLARIRRHSFIMREVVPHLPKLAQDVVRFGPPVQPAEQLFGDHPVIAPRWLIAQELEAMFTAAGAKRDMHELWAYYGAYDHLVLSQTFGTMMQLPESVPMFTRELMQLEADVNHRRARRGLQDVERPAKGAEHHAAADAEWNLAFHQALTAGDQGYDGPPLGWTIHEERDLVTVPSRVFIAGYERLESVGPNEGLDPADEEPARRLWDALI